MNATARKRVALLVIVVIVIVAASYTIPLLVMTKQDTGSVSGNVTVECESSCIEKVELWSTNNGHPTFVKDVTCYVDELDSKSVSYSKDYFLRVYLEEGESLVQGDVISIYAKWNTVPPTKSVILEDTSGNVIGGGDVLSQWNYYDLTITASISPITIVDIWIDGSNPSSSQMGVNYIKCYHSCTSSWHDDCGHTITTYGITLQYKVTIDGTILDASKVYLDLSIQERIIATSCGTFILGTMIEKISFKVSSVGTTLSFTTNAIPVPSRAAVGTDHITISFNVTAIAMAQVINSNNWIGVQKAYAGIRTITLSWY